MANTVHIAKKKDRYALYFQNSENYLILLCVGMHTVIISLEYCIFFNFYMEISSTHNQKYNIYNNIQVPDT